MEELDQFLIYRWSRGEGRALLSFGCLWILRCWVYLSTKLDLKTER